jgi:DNA adenine methylase
MKTKTKPVSSPLKWHGGKSYLAKEIVAMMPPRCMNPNKPDPADKGWLHYVEPFAGGLSVLLANDPEGISEIANDLNGPLTNFWNCMMNPELFVEFRRGVEAMPFAESLWENAVGALKMDLPPVDSALAFFIVCRQSLAGRNDAFTGVTRSRSRRGMNAEVSAWLNCVERLPAVHERLKRVLVRNRPALDIIRGEDGPRTLFYLDPPYLFETRATTGEYAHEMTDEQHKDLLCTLTGIEGRFLLSGYRSKLYDEYAERCGWNLKEIDMPNHSAGGKEKQRRIECVWTNF